MLRELDVDTESLREKFPEDIKDLETISIGLFLPITFREPKKGATDGQAKETS